MKKTGAGAENGPQDLPPVSHENTLTNSKSSAKETPSASSGPVELSPAEKWTYIFGWCGAVGYCYYAVYLASKEYAPQLETYDVRSGWAVFGGKKDVSNFEWSFWSSLYLAIWRLVLGHVIIGQVAKFIPGLWQLRGVFFMIYGVGSLTYLIGPKATLLFLSQSALYYVVSLAGSPLLIWGLAISLILASNNDWLTTVMEDLNWDPDFLAGYFMITADLALCNIRNTSAALSVAKSKPWQQHGHLKTIHHWITYVFYCPLFYAGPLLTFDEFQKQINKSNESMSSQKKISIIWKLARLLFWTFVIEAHLHWFHFTALQKARNIMEVLPNWAVAGVGFCQGQFFMLKYVVMFGLPAWLASLDNIETPSFPKCISRIYLYSEMWKSFDTGLYNFMKTHIYIPLGGSRRGALRQLFASFCCFTYIFLWHGGTYYLFVWTLLNHIGICTEVLCTKLSRIQSVQDFEAKLLSPRMSRRVRAVAGVPMFCMSAVAIFYFFGGSSMGFLTLRRLLYDGFPVAPFTVFVFIYCMVQTSMEVQIWEQKRKLKPL